MDMLKKLISKGYHFVNYENWNSFLGQKEEKTVILRHDIDESLKKAVVLSEIENKICGNATYFILLSTNFYNVHSKESRGYIESIIKNGGNIGLHFDETQYNIQTKNELEECVYAEADMLSRIIGSKVSVVSMHRPSGKFLSGNIEFTNIINSYSDVYFKDMKYLSDSRRCWREDIDEIIAQDMYSRLHILTHPFWYSVREESLRQTLQGAILNASLDYYDNVNNNFRNLHEEVERFEIENRIYRI